MNAFSLGWACCQNRHEGAEQELPASFATLDLSAVDVRFVLVIKDHEEEWLVPLANALRDVFHATVKTWNFQPLAVEVMNEALARKCNLVA